MEKSNATKPRECRNCACHGASETPNEVFVASRIHRRTRVSLGFRSAIEPLPLRGQSYSRCGSCDSKFFPCLTVLSRARMCKVWAILFASSGEHKQCQDSDRRIHWMRTCSPASRRRKLQAGISTISPASTNTELWQGVGSFDPPSAFWTKCQRTAQSVRR